MSTSIMTSTNMSIINTQEYRNRQRERERERDQDQEDGSDNTHTRKKTRSSAHLPSPPLPTATYTADDQLNSTNPVPHIAASAITGTIPTSSLSASVSMPELMARNISAVTATTTSSPGSPILTTTVSKQTLSHPQQPLAQTQTQPLIQQHIQAQQQQKQQKQPSPHPPTSIYTIDDFITRYACKMHYGDQLIKGQMQKIETVKHDPTQEQKYRELYVGLSSLEIKVREYEEKIESLFRLKFNGK
ncbi:hypothetical protein K457DRAFT_16795 [Linnemannia elongata AG-77]|uniref:Uncharacterized protein n=1 Tax=Linnemannia elongata AG-77 TaxID=1314771 RepID=A0A197K5D0_9FUNG|nr:hypothetical protein K457DRAFT_16795 [Linnemannia elongata AG-77]